MDYRELVKRIHSQAVYLPEKFSKNAELLDVLMKAADAIEELKKDLERSKEYETFWEKEANEALKKFKVAVASKPRWIPVTEQLPEEYVNVLCYCSRNKQYGCGEWSKEDNGTIYWSGLNGMIPTHWMPLPEPPKEETE